MLIGYQIATVCLQNAGSLAHLAAVDFLAVKPQLLTECEPMISIVQNHQKLPKSTLSLLFLHEIHV
jgi:hypothetical protein